MSQETGVYRFVPYPKVRRLMVDGGRLARQKHLVHGLVEMDVTRARRLLHAHRARTGEQLSFTGFVLTCVGQAVDANKHMQAYRTWGNRLVLFEDVDVNTMFEVEEGGRKIIRPHIIRAANRKTYREIHEEIRRFQAGQGRGRESAFIDWFVQLPGFARRGLLRLILKSPRRLRDMNGTVSLTAIGMFGDGPGWGLPVSNHTLQITLGGIARKPALVDAHLEERQYLCVTVTIDHDIVDGAPAARFTQRLKTLIESAHGLEEIIAPDADG